MNEEQTQQTLVRFQCLITRDQLAYLRRLAAEEGISGGYVVRKGLSLYAALYTKERGDKIQHRDLREQQLHDLMDTGDDDVREIAESDLFKESPDNYEN